MTVINRLPTRETNQRDAGEKARIFDGVHDLLGDGNTGGGHTSDAAYDRLHNTAADGKCWS